MSTLIFVLLMVLLCQENFCESISDEFQLQEEKSDSLSLNKKENERHSNNIREQESSSNKSSNSIISTTDLESFGTAKFNDGETKKQRLDIDSEYLSPLLKQISNRIKLKSEILKSNSNSFGSKKIDSFGPTLADINTINNWPSEISTINVESFTTAASDIDDQRLEQSKGPADIFNDFDYWSKKTFDENKKYNNFPINIPDNMGDILKNLDTQYEKDLNIQYEREINYENTQSDDNGWTVGEINLVYKAVLLVIVLLITGIVACFKWLKKLVKSKSCVTAEEAVPLCNV